MLHWVLFGSPLTGSSRIHGYRVHDHLRRLGYASSILVGPPPPVEAYDLPWSDSSPLLQAGVIRSGDVVVLETVRGQRAAHFVEQLRNAGVRTVFAECDHYDDTTTLELCDDVVCSSSYLATAHEQKTGRRPHVIDDAVEELLPPSDLASRTSPRREGLTLAWVGNGLHWATLDGLRRLLKEPSFGSWRLLTVSNHPQADVAWSPRRALDALRTCDVAVVPAAATERARCKSNNRVTQAMALGAPVVCDALPAYAEVVRSGTNGFLCHDAGEWRAALVQLRDPEVRSRISQAGHEAVSARFTMDVIAQEWVAALGLKPSPMRRLPTPPRDLRYEAAMAYSQWFEDHGQPGKAFGPALHAAWLNPARFPWGRPLLLLNRSLRSWRSRSPVSMVNP